VVGWGWGGDQRGIGGESAGGAREHSCGGGKRDRRRTGVDSGRGGWGVDDGRDDDGG